MIDEEDLNIFSHLEDINGVIDVRLVFGDDLPSAMKLAEETNASECIKVAYIDARSINVDRSYSLQNSRSEGVETLDGEGVLSGTSQPQKKEDRDE